MFPSAPYLTTAPRQSPDNTSESQQIQTLTPPSLILRRTHPPRSRRQSAISGMSGRLSTRLTSNAAALLRPLGRPYLGPVTASLVAPPPLLQRPSSTQSRSASTPNRTTFTAKIPADRNLFTNASELGRISRFHLEDDHIKLWFEHCWHLNDDPIELPYLWLRDICSCAHCVSESSGQKRFATCDIDARPSLVSCREVEHGALELVWADDFMSRSRDGGENTHTSVLPLDLLQRLLVDGVIPKLPHPRRTIWDRATLNDEALASRAVSWGDWMQGGPAFARALFDLAQWGLIIVKGVPEDKAAVSQIAEKIGPLQSTFYGLTWDVISKPDAENVAYTNEFLCLHQDLMYWHDPPKIQLLHCLANECHGGDSLFSDGFRAAAEFKLQRTQQWSILQRMPVTFHYARNGNFYHQQRHVIESGGDVLPKSVHWAPPFQGQFPPLVRGSYSKGSPLLSEWRDAARAFRDSLEAPQNMVQYRLQAGDCVLFDNQRILHGRTQFDTSSGRRHLHGTYVDAQTMSSALARVVRGGHFTAQENPRLVTQLEARMARNMYPQKGGKTSSGQETAPSEAKAGGSS